MRKSLNTSTALIASLSLFASGPAPAQETVPDEVPMVCADGSDQPCAEGVPLVPAPGAETPEAAPDAEPAPEADVSEPEAAPEAAGEPATPVATPEAVEDPAAPEAAPEAAGEPATPEAAPEQPAVVEPDADAPVTNDLDATVTEPAEAPAEAAPAADEATGTDAAGETGAGTAPAPDGDAATAEVPPVLPVQPDAATGEAPAAAAASADPAAEAPAAKVTEEVVTEETARSSSEDFANPVSESAAATAAAPAAKKDSGLSDGEKAVLLGLGALAVGALLSNNRKVELNSGDRVVVQRPDGTYQIIKDDNALLRQPGSTVRTENFDDGSTRTTVTREDGSQIVTIRDAGFRVLRRVHVARDGTRTLLFDDTVAHRPVDVTRLPPPAPEIRIGPDADLVSLRAALSRHADFDRAFSLAQIRDIRAVRALVPVIDLDAITFETGSAAIRPDQAENLSRLGRLMTSYIDSNPREIFLIEGHTDAVGSAASNLALSDRRAESVALALTEYFDVPPENLVVQGYGEEFLKVATEGPSRENRRASVRRITDLLREAAN
jgi:outer membrane protein OmpA-like peptidoglycan-associated protein